MTSGKQDIKLTQPNFYGSGQTSICIYRALMELKKRGCKDCFLFTPCPIDNGEKVCNHFQMLLLHPHFLCSCLVMEDLRKYKQKQ